MRLRLRHCLVGVVLALLVVPVVTVLDATPTPVAGFSPGNIVVPGSAAVPAP